MCVSKWHCMLLSRAYQWTCEKNEPSLGHKEQKMQVTCMISTCVSIDLWKELGQSLFTKSNKCKLRWWHMRDIMELRCVTEQSMIHEETNTSSYHHVRIKVVALKVIIMWVSIDLWKQLGQSLVHKRAKNAIYHVETLLNKAVRRAVVASPPCGGCWMASCCCCRCWKESPWR